MYLRRNSDGTFSNVWSLSDATHYHAGGGEFLPLPDWLPRSKPWAALNKLCQESTPTNVPESYAQQFFSSRKTDSPPRGA